MKVLRCAVYTRKSTVDGLEQEFNSLDAQREACKAYITSQRHEGWTLMPGHYDDGGFSGGNMERPGLIALLADVDAGQVDVIVVYKVDRLTRSLADFAKIVERLVVTKIQLRTSGPHRGGIPFARGSLFDVLKNPIYRGKIVHKGKIYDGEHESIVDADLWDQVQLQLAEKAPPRKRQTNQPQRALLAGLISDCEGRQVVATYAIKRNRRYAYYEPRKDLARSHRPPSTRLSQGVLDNHVLRQFDELLGDEHALRRLSGVVAAGALAQLFDAAKVLRSRLDRSNERQAALRDLIAHIKIEADQLAINLKPAALGLAIGGCWTWSIPLPSRRPFREARLRIHADGEVGLVDQGLAALLSDACEAQNLIPAAPGIIINQVAEASGRCRKQFTKHFVLSWLSSQIVESIIAGTQPTRLTRTQLLQAELKLDWHEQEALFGLSA